MRFVALNGCRWYVGRGQRLYTCFVQAFSSWFTSQIGVSLLVALIALGGVLVTTWWNNRAADERRRADQTAADKRRLADQAAEDARRKADDDRREQERRDQLQREDLTRQRRAVAECINVFKEEFPELGNLRVGIPVNDPDEDGSKFRQYVVKGEQLLGFYRAIIRGLDFADLEISNARVRTAIRNLRESTNEEYGELLNAEGEGQDPVGVIAMGTNAIGPKMEDSLRKLVDVASQEYLDVSCNKED